MSKDKKQSVSHFTEEQLTPLEQKFAEAKANRDAGVEPYKMVPVELWNEIKWALHLGRENLKMARRITTSEILSDTLEKMKQL